MVDQSPAGPEVICEMRGAACWVRLNRPRVMNALNGTALRLLAEAVEQAVAAPTVRAIVLIGEGGRAFSSGGDLRERSAPATPGEADETERLSIEAFGMLRNCPKPVIAAIDGYCLGAGCEIAALADMRLATESSRFGLPEVRHSLMPDPGLIELPRILPRGELMQMLLAGRPLSAQRAHEIGFVQQLLPDRTALIDAADALAAEIALGAPVAAAAYKQVVCQTEAGLLARATGLRAPLWEGIKASADAREGERAFAEKRAPIWRNT